MSLNLLEIVEKADDIHHLIINGESKDPDSDLKYIAEKIKEIQSVVYQLANIYNSCKYITKNKNVPNILPSLDEWTRVSGKYNSPKLVSRESAPKMIVKSCDVDDIKDVPNTNLYFVRNIGQFALRINNVVFRGNVGDIFAHVFGAKKTAKLRQVTHCNNYSKCVRNGVLCNFYHDPLKLLVLSSKKFETQRRNFTNSSWLYAPTKEGCRSLGNGSSAHTDINLPQHDEQLFRDQCIHQLLLALSTPSSGS